ncbi:MAG: carbamoyltransferase HypF [Bacteroidota bacterium]
MQKGFLIKVTGLVQGVGFRPFIHRMALKYHLKGDVENTNEGVLIHVEGDEKIIIRFIASIRNEAPPASSISEIISNEIDLKGYSDFQIIRSQSKSQKITEVSPDIAVCPECLADIEIQPNRILYPFVNCTNCGPRFSIIRDLPYDREKTSMDVFPMCDTCRKEYEEVTDRRFHAQPVACSDCGPKYTLIADGIEYRDIQKIVAKVAKLLDLGKIVAMKGLGGFHLACNAFNEESVNRLREIKNREGKPFAVLFANKETLIEQAHPVPEEIKSLESWRRPIVLVKLKQESTIAPGVTRGLNTLGVMLPYLPFHHLIFNKLQCNAVVLTSGNFSDEPIIIQNEEAILQFAAKVDALLHYNREIVNRTDDSVVRIIGDRERVFRRSRGYAPSPVRLTMDVEGILATGGEMVNCFCVGKGNMAIPSQYMGDLKNLETSAFYEESVAKYQRLFRMEPRLIVSDMHPEYFTTRWAEGYSPLIPVMKVQHHHAHIASCMAENGLDEKVIGVAMDGTGYGDDGNIWGAEFFICDLENYTRSNHFEYLPLPGGDKAVEEPWRMAVSYLYAAFGEQFSTLDLPFLNHPQISSSSNLLIKMIQSGINCPLVSSAGRLFDAIAALTGICEVSTFQAEAPMRLEQAAIMEDDHQYDYSVNETIGFLPMIRQIVDDIQRGVNPGIIAGKFHHTVISAIFDQVKRMGLDSGLKKVVLSGGTFQNKILLENIESRLALDGFQVYSQSRIPSNDGGIALGQLAIAAKRREKGCV